jgi:ribosomal protein S18 acetylase RimI-like enzyme
VPTEVLIRRGEPSEHDAIRALVQTIVDEIYGNVCGPPPIAIDEEDWPLAWVAVSSVKVVGMVLTHGEWISDLWVLRESRGLGIGQRLLALGETEIAERGHQTLRLRVAKSNQRAVRFYERYGWEIAREFPHEKLPITVLEMMKLAQSDTMPAS